MRPYPVAIVGSGPSGFSAVTSLSKAANAANQIEVTVDTLEILRASSRLLRPGGKGRNVLPFNIFAIESWSESTVETVVFGRNEVVSDDSAPSGAAKVGMTDNDPVAVKGRGSSDNAGAAADRVIRPSGNREG